MAETREHSKTSGNLRFGTRREADLPATAGSQFPEAPQSTAVAEHPRMRVVREQESHERVGLLFRHWLSLIIGVSVGVALVIAFQLSSNLPKADAPVETAAAIKVSVVDPNADHSAAKAAPATESQSQAKVVTQEEPSNIIEHARTRAVQLEQRKFLFTSGKGMRSYDPEFVSSDANGQFDFKQGETQQALSLKPLDDGLGRYELSGTNVQWQGAWQPADPERNIKLGSAYVDYMNKTFGNSVDTNLSVVNKSPTSLLGRMPRKVSGPSDLRSYSPGGR